ncbi:MAG: hypothetical protein II984_07455, partial [Clostridia bacterium]|nr:hypothetical protein [Clostridia bacterium]
VENFFELWRRQLKNFQDKGRTKARGFIVLRQMCSIPVRLSISKNLPILRMQNNLPALLRKAI